MAHTLLTRLLVFAGTHSTCIRRQIMRLAHEDVDRQPRASVTFHP